MRAAGSKRKLFVASEIAHAPGRRFLIWASRFKATRRRKILIRNVQRDPRTILPATA
jgi:hypothetical protein